MNYSELQFLSDHEGSVQSGVVPIDLWHQLNARVETFYISQNPVWYARIREAMTRGTGISFDESLRQIEYDAAGFEDLAWWNKNHQDRARDIVRLVREVQQAPYEGRGYPVQLTGDLEGCVSRRIDDHHRLVYQVLDDKIRILSCRRNGS